MSEVACSRAQEAFPFWGNQKESPRSGSRFLHGFLLGSPVRFFQGWDTALHAPALQLLAPRLH